MTPPTHLQVSAKPGAQAFARRAPKARPSQRRVAPRRREPVRPRELSSFCFPTCLESTWRARSCPWGAEPAVTGVRRRGESTLRDVAQLRTERLLHHLSGAA